MRAFFTVVGVVTVCGWIADLVFGSALALRGLPISSHFGGPFMHFAYGLFRGTTP